MLAGGDKPEPLDDEDLAAALNAEIEASTGSFGDPLGTQRAELLSIYLRTGYQDDELARQEDRSDFVDSTAQDSVENILGELLEILMGAETIASFMPNGPDDEKGARQETAAVHHIFFNQNPGYLILQAWLMDALTLINGYVKAWHDERFVVETETYSGQTEESMRAVIADLELDGARVEVLFQDREETSATFSQEDLAVSPDLQDEIDQADEYQQDPKTGEITIMSRSLTYKLKIRRKKRSFKIVPVAPDEILISPRWDSVDLTGCPFVAHRYLTTQSDLISRGFDADQVRSLPIASDQEFAAERLARFEGYEAGEGLDRGSVDQSSRMALVTECFAYIDRDGDGIAELIMATVAGDAGELMTYEDGSVAVVEIEECPIHCWTPYIIPHRHHGESVVQRVKQVQRSKSVFQRQLHDGTVFAANPRVVVGRKGMGNDTLDDLLIYRPGGIVRANDANQVVPMKVTSTAADIMPVLDRLSDITEERTGATRINQGLVADKFGKQIAGITIAQLSEKGMAKINMIARNFLETGFASLMKHLHALLHRHHDEELAYQVGEVWEVTRPRSWGARSEVKVGVGLGQTGRYVKTEVLREIVQRQTEAIQFGSRLADEQGIYNALSDLAKANGLANPDRYFNNPELLGPPPPKEEQDPAADLAAAQVEVAKTEARTRQQAVVQKERNDSRQALLRSRELNLRQRELSLKAYEIELKDDRERDLAALQAQMQALGRAFDEIRAQVQAPEQKALPAPSAGDGGQAATPA